MDPSEVTNAVRAIEDWVRPITELSQSKVPSLGYFRELVDGLVRRLAARGGAFWLHDRGKWSIPYHVGLENVGIPENRLHERSHVRLVERALASDSPSATLQLFLEQVCEIAGKSAVFCRT